MCVFLKKESLEHIICQFSPEQLVVMTKTTHVKGDNICFLVFFIHERQALSTFLATLVVLHSALVAGSLGGQSFELA